MNRSRSRSRSLAIALIALAGSLLPVTAAQARALEPITGTIEWNDVRQEIDGWGASGAFKQAAAIQKLPEPARTQVLDLLFRQDTGIGLSVVRNLVPVFEPAPGVYDYTRDDDQIWLMQEAKARGASRFMSTVWSPPAWMKDNQKVCCGGSVSPAVWPLFADYLAEYVLQYKARFGLDIYAISPANEPDASTSYDSSRWTGQQLRDFTRDFVAPVWAQKQVPAKYIIPETSYWGEDLALPSLQDPDFPGFPSAGKRVDIVAAHGYGRDNPPAPLAVSKAAGKRIWETETSELGIAEDATITNGLFWAKRIQEFMTGPEVNLFNSWWLATELENRREGLIDLHTQTQPYTYTTTKRLFTIGNWSRFVRPGWVRVGATAARSPITAFRDPASGSFAVVVTNDSSTSRSEVLRLNGFAATSVTPYRTSKTENLAALAPVDASTGSFTATLPPRSVTTFVGTGTQTSPLAATVGDGKVWTGESTTVPVTVRNAGPNPVSGTVEMAAGSLAVEPSSASFSLPPGASTTFPVTVSPPAGSAGGLSPVQAFARVDAGAGADVVGMGQVSVSANDIAFVPNTLGERPWLLPGGGSQLDGAVEDGNARFTDGTSTATYRFDLPADVSGGTITVDVLNEFLVSTSTDGNTFTERLREEREVKDGSNRADRTIDLETARAGGTTVFMRIGDSFPGDGWGTWLGHVRISVERSAAAPVVPEAPVAALVPITAAGVGLAIAAARRRRSPGFAAR